MKLAARAAAIAALALLAGSAMAQGGLAQSSEADFLKRFDSSFSGGGKVRTSADGSPYNVKCKVAGNSTASTVDINGTCTALAVVSRKIGASLKVDANGHYTGTYVGSKIGPAALAGRRRGDSVILNVTWPKPVNGDTKAHDDHHQYRLGLHLRGRRFVGPRRVECPYDRHQREPLISIRCRPSSIGLRRMRSDGTFSAPPPRHNLFQLAPDLTGFWRHF